MPLTYILIYAWRGHAKTFRGVCKWRYFKGDVFANPQLLYVFTLKLDICKLICTVHLLSPFFCPDFVPILLGKSEPESVLFGMNTRCVTWGTSTGRVPEVRLQKKFPQDTSRAALCLHLSLRQSVSAAAAHEEHASSSLQGFTTVAPTCLTTGDSRDCLTVTGKFT